MTTASRRLFRRFPAALVLAVLVGVTGCGPTLHPVGGKVAYEDGSPVPEGSVVGETTIDGKGVMVQGTVAADGTFKWGTFKAGDGARPGKYRVIVVPRSLSDAELATGAVPSVDEKFTKYDTSGLEAEVKEGKNDLKLTVAKPAPKPKEPDPAADPKAKTEPEPKAEPKKTDSPK